MNQFVSFVALFLSLVSQMLCSTTPATSVEDNSKQVDQHTSELMRNAKIRDVYINCLLDKAPCSNEAADVKKMMPEAVQHGCEKCTEMHKKIIEKMMFFLKERQPEVLEQVSAKFDPKGEFMKTFLNKLQQQHNQSNESGQQYGQNAPLIPQGQYGQNTQQAKPIRN